MSLQGPSVSDRPDAAQSPEVLVTGGTGFIGSWLLAALTARGRSVAALMRHAGDRQAELGAWVDARGGNSELIVPVDSDLTGDLGLDDPRLSSVRDVYHLAARFGFGLGIDEARAANVAPSLELVEWAASLTHLRRFVLVTGYRSESDTWRRVVDEGSPAAWTAALAAHGAYETSKMEADVAVRSRAERLGVPLTRVHPALVIGHSDTGETNQTTGLAETIGDLRNGSLPVLPATRGTWLPLIPVDWVAAFLAQIVEDDSSVGGSYPLLDERTPPFTELIAQVASHLGVRAPRLRINPAILRRLPSRLTGVTGEQLSFISADRYPMESTNRVAARMELPGYDLDAATRAWVDHLVATDFGANPG